MLGSEVCAIAPAVNAEANAAAKRNVLTIASVIFGCTKPPRVHTTIEGEEPAYLSSTSI
jgi:hypothetical protein